MAQMTLSVPPVERFENETIAAAIAEHTRVAELLEAATRRAGELQAQVEELRASDLQSLADARRRGERAPDTKQLKKVEDELAAAEREVAALRIARNDCRFSVDAAIDEHRDEIKERFAARAQEANARSVALFEEFEQAYAAHMAALGVQRWLDEWPNTRLGDQPVRRLSRATNPANGEPISVDTIIHGLRSEVVDWTGPAKPTSNFGGPPNPQPFRAVPRAA